MTKLDTFKGHLLYSDNQMDVMCDHAQTCLIEADDVPIFQSCGALVQTLRAAEIDTAADGITRPKGSLIVKPVPKLQLHEWLQRHALFYRRKPKKGSNVMGRERFTAPQKIADYILQRQRSWTFPVLNGIIESPTVLADGTLLTNEGYDPKSGLYLNTNGIAFPEIKNWPTRADALQAIRTLKEPFLEFPFVLAEGETPDSNMPMSVVLAAIMTGLTRANYSTAPGFAIDAADPGTGKTLLSDCISTIVTGHVPAALVLTESEAENEKRLHGAFLAKDPIIYIDNINGTISGQALAAVLTREMWSSRFLGVTGNLPVSTKTLFLFNGNNLVVSREMARRLVVARMVANCERPRERTGFKYNLLEYIPENRTRLVAAALTVLRAFHVAGRPSFDGLNALGHPEWERVVRGALLWCGEADPVATTGQLEDNNFESDVFKKILRAMLHRFGENFVTAHDLLKAPDEMDDVEDAGRRARMRYRAQEILNTVLADAELEKSRNLGRYLTKHKDSVVGNMRLQRSPKPDRMGNHRYRVELVHEFG